MTNRIKTWWNDNHTNIVHNVEEGIRSFARGMSRIADNITRLVLCGVIINVIASYFYPDFPKRFPAIYGWFDGCLQFGEFAVKTVLSGMYALFTGTWSEFWTEYNLAFKELLQQFLNWISTLHF